jgi:hypothetical protein
MVMPRNGEPTPTPCGQGREAAMKYAISLMNFGYLGDLRVLVEP